MVEVIVFAEGQTEEKFIKSLIAPALNHLQIYLKPQLLNTSKDSKGGGITFDRLKFNARNTLRQNQKVILSTFLDLYGLDTSFPGYQEKLKETDPCLKAKVIEQALHKSLIEYVGCQSDRFLPHIQPYEFEGLLFSDVEALSETEPKWKKALIELQKVRSQVESPEHINDGYETKPSKRLENLLKPSYKKTIHGPRAAERITLETIEAQCLHFKEWMNKLRNLNN